VMGGGGRGCVGEGGGGAGGGCLWGGGGVGGGGGWGVGGGGGGGGGGEEGGVCGGGGGGSGPLLEMVSQRRVGLGPLANRFKNLTCRKKKRLVSRRSLLLEKSAVHVQMSLVDCVRGVTAV